MNTMYSHGAFDTITAVAPLQVSHVSKFKRAADSGGCFRTCGLIENAGGLVDTWSMRGEDHLGEKWTSHMGANDCDAIYLPPL